MQDIAGGRNRKDTKESLMRWLVTGGVGFIGTNLVSQLLEASHEVVVVDDMSRSGVELNANFLSAQYGIEPHILDVSHERELSEFLQVQPPFDAIAHLAGQVSLLESINDPMRDFAVNAGGTLNLLNHIRMHSKGTALIGMSSNKVYGDLAGVTFEEMSTRYVAGDWPNGFDESLPLDFHGPYGCSKGTADQYLADFSRTYGLRTASLRQSSVYGPHQHPRSDQGWVAHLVTEAVHGRLIQLNGKGKQVRDLLHARDLSRLIMSLGESIEPYGSHQFNVGGGPSNSLSILELFERLERDFGISADFVSGSERPSDQKVFVSNNAKVSAMTGWLPKIRISEGLSALVGSVQAARSAHE